jgi:hypothetical protein
VLSKSASDCRPGGRGGACMRAVCVPRAGGSDLPRAGAGTAAQSAESLAAACAEHAEWGALSAPQKLSAQQLRAVLGSPDHGELAALLSAVQMARGEAAVARDLVEQEVSSFCVTQNVARRRKMKGVMPLEDRHGVVEAAVKRAASQHEAWERDLSLSSVPPSIVSRQRVMRRALRLWRVYAAA